MSKAGWSEAGTFEDIVGCSRTTGGRTGRGEGDRSCDERLSHRPADANLLEKSRRGLGFWSWRLTRGGVVSGVWGSEAGADRLGVLNGVDSGVGGWRAAGEEGNC